jgi:hypothetical protein
MLALFGPLLLVFWNIKIKLLLLDSLNCQFKVMLLQLGS